MMLHYINALLIPTDVALTNNTLKPVYITAFSPPGVYLHYHHFCVHFIRILKLYTHSIKSVLVRQESNRWRSQYCTMVLSLEIHRSLQSRR